MKIRNLTYRLLVLILRSSLVAVLLISGWFVYKQLPPPSSADSDEQAKGGTAVQILLRRDQKITAIALDVPVELYPIDIVAVRHEFFAERRAGERFDDFLKQRMKGRSPVTTKFNSQGQATVIVTPGNWWIHATLPGEEDFEWRLPVSIGGRQQIVELTQQNAYTRTKSF